ncbi:MAG: 2'-5' RNA ligase family protein [Flavisolibacter sp.]
MKMYYIAVVLPGELNAVIIKHKELMLERFQAKVGLKSPAHITIIPPFWMEPAREPSLISDVNHVADEIVPFEIQTKNFNCFKPRTIYVDVQHSPPLKALKETAEEFFTAGEYKIKREERPFRPHITIATRDLAKHHFAEAWAIFENKKFEKEFTADSLSLLRHNGKTWDVINKSPFSGITQT